MKKIHPMPETADKVRQSDPIFQPSPACRRRSWVDGLHMPSLLKVALPGQLVNRLRGLKGRILTRGFPRDETFDQSLNDIVASGSLSIVVPIHDAPLATSRCLTSLEKYAPQAEIILVDDGSRTSKIRDLLGAFITRNGWKSVCHNKALGHSEACKSGARLATRPYLCLLNSDTVVTPWCWRPVTEAFECNLDIGVAGPSTSYAGTLQVLPVANYFRPYWNDSQICGFAKSLLSEHEDLTIMDLTWVSGFAFFIRRTLWEQLCGFDPNLPDYGNEVELCNRVAAKGYRRVWITNSYIHHFGEESYSGAIGHRGIRARIEAADVYLKQRNCSSRG